MIGGGVGMTIPLASLPKGRGSAGFSVSISYDSKLWDSAQKWESDALEPTYSNPTRHDYPRNLLIPAEEGGWQFHTVYKLKVTYRNESNLYESAPQEQCLPFNDNYSKNGYAYKVLMNMPGGGAMTFRPYGSGAYYTDFHKDGFYKIDPNGRGHDWALSTVVNDPLLGTYANCSMNTPQVTTGGMYYYSQDGSGVRLFIPYDTAYTNNATTSDRNWTMFYPDGTIVENKPQDDLSLIQRITDSNGNRVRIKSDTYNGIYGTKIVDDLERFIFVGWSGGSTKVYQSGVGGAVLETTLTWKNVWVYRKYRTVDPGFIHSIPEYKKFEEIKQEVHVLDTITLPTQASSLTYEFEYYGSDTDPGSGPENYTQGWGELKSVKTPSDAVAEYSYQLPDEESVLTYFLDILRNSVVKKELTHDGSTNPDTWTYQIDYAGSSSTAPNGSSSVQNHYGKSPYLPDQGIDWRNGLVYRIVNPDGSTIERVWKQHQDPIEITGQPLNPYIAEEITTIPDSNGNPALKTKKEFDYDQNSNLLEVREYDFIPVAQSNFPLKRKTVNTYYNPTLGMSSSTTDGNWYANPNSPIQLKLLKSTEVQDALGTPVSRSEFVYDNSTTNPTKGNLTETKTWDSFKGGQYRTYSDPLTTTNSISTSVTYNQYGMPLTMTDAKNVTTQLTYGNVVGPNGTVTDLYPTQTVAAHGTDVARTSAATYDFYTGAVKTATDVDNNVAVVNEYDALGRSTKVRSAANTPLETWTRTEYDDVNRRVIVRSDLETIEDGKKVAIQHFDQLGRVRLSRTLENAATEDPYNETHGIKVQTRYKTVAGFNYQVTSNPYRAATTTAETDPTMGWTLSTAWSHGRRSEVETFSGAALPTVFGGSNTNSTGIVTTQTDADRTLVTDQAGKSRISRTNALGQLKEVWEVLAASEPGSESISFPNTSVAHGFKTTYAYDTLSNLTTVNQGVQTRTFSYSSLSRLLSATNPESGTISYGYDPNGNLTNKTDARGVVTSYVYDALNRITQRNYTAPGGLPNYQATPNVSYFYDNLPNAKGKLTKVSSSVSTTEYTSFDILGRVTGHKQTTDGQNYTTGYVYNLSGALIEETYPSGRKVKNTLDVNGDLAQVQSQKSSTDIWRPYASTFVYNAAGTVSSLKLGNGKFENTTFNSRLQPTQIGLGSSATDQGLLKLNYDYGTTANNGNILSQTFTVPTIGQTTGFVATQTYSYDSLNRLKQATENITPNGGSQTLSWQQTYTFDRYGNRNFDEANTTTLPKDCTESGNPVVCEAIRPIVNPSVNTSDNRLNGYTFDPSGNTTIDAEGRRFTYDAENKQVIVKDSQNQTIGEYSYDGDAKRVKKVVPATGETTIFVYDLEGKMVAEYSTQTEQAPKVSYLTHDHLGSPRILTDQFGAIISRRDFRPYGEEIVRPGYGQDSVREKFATYERDDESGLDYGKARYSRASLGRFLSADRYFLLDPPAESTATNSPDIVSLRFFVQPQYLNRYIYTVNNPLKFVDIEGLHPGAAAVAVPLIKAAFIGAAIGAAAGAAIEVGRQIYNDGEITNKNAILRSAGEGAIYGAFVGVAGPVGAQIARPLAARVVFGAAGSTVAGTGTRYSAGESTTTGDVITDAMAGALGGAAGYGASKLPILPARVYLPNNSVTRAATRTTITKVRFDGQGGIWWSPYSLYGDSVVGNVVRSATKTGTKKIKEKKEKWTTEVTGYELFLEH